jgi:DNA-binding LacI/PurR family transcriptional regulator
LFQSGGWHPIERSFKPRTIGEVAAHLGVSAMTVHRAIAGKPDVAPKTRARILAEVERLGWRPNMAARGLRQGKTYTLGVLVSNVSASFLPEILQGIDRTAEAEGYHTFVCVHEHELERAERHLQNLRSKGVDGIVYYPTPDGAEAALLNEIQRTTPIAVVMREVPGFTGPSVRIDDRLGGRLAVRHLLELGHTRIGFVGYVDNDFSHLRWQGYLEELAAWEISPRPGWTFRGVPIQVPAVDAVREILEQPDRPTALFCASDRLAAWAMQAALAVGLRVPDELSLVGYNGDPWGELLSVPLTTVAQLRFEVGVEAAQRVLSPSEDEEGRRVVLEPRLVTRASTGPPGVGPGPALPGSVSPVK